MLTDEQKEMIAQRLAEKFMAYSDLVDELSESMYKAASEYDTNYDKVMYYGKDGLYVDRFDSIRGNLRDAHYYSVSHHATLSEHRMMTQMLCVYLNNESPGASSGHGQRFGWFYDSNDNSVKLEKTSQYWFLKEVMRSSTDNIRDFVFVNADRNPSLIVRANKWLDLDFKEDLVRLVCDVINAGTKAYENAYNAAMEEEEKNDNVLLAEFGMRKMATKIKTKTWKIELKEVEK